MLEITIDIETIPPPMSEEEKRALAAVKVPATYKKKESIEKWIDANYLEQWQRLALDHHRAVVVAIGCEVHGGRKGCMLADPAVADPERELFQRLELWVKANNHTGIRWVGHNIAGFDLPMIFKRAVKYGCSALARATFISKPWDTRAADTMLMWPGSKWSKLDDIAEFLGIERPPGWENEGNHGDQVLALWEAGYTEQIGIACMSDVEITTEIARRLRAVGGAW